MLFIISKFKAIGCGTELFNGKAAKGPGAEFPMVIPLLSSAMLRSESGQNLFHSIRDSIRKLLIISDLPRMDSNHDKVIQSYLCSRGLRHRHGPTTAEGCGFEPRATGFSDTLKTLEILSARWC